MAWTGTGRPTGHRLVHRRAGVEHRLAAQRIALEGGDSRLIRHLEGCGARVGKGDADLSVVVCDDYCEPRLAKTNRRQLEAGAPWILVRPLGMQALFGPVFRADSQGPCWDCLAHRMRSHQEVHGFLRARAGEEAAFRPFASQPVVLDAVCGLIAAEIVKWLVLEGEAPLHEHTIAMNVGTFASSQHRVMRRPQCRSCGDRALYRPDRPPVPLSLNASPKAYHNSGGVRAVTPEVTLANYRHLVSPVSGVVSWLSRTTGETDPWLHVHWAGSNPGVSGRSLSSLRRSLRSKSAGKGSTHQQSETSALCEAVERYSGALAVTRSVSAGASASSPGKGKHSIPTTCSCSARTSSTGPGPSTHRGHPYNIVPSRFDPDAETEWTPVWSFTRQKHLYLPTSMLYSMPAEERGPADLVADSNGCAAGNTLEEAILQGFYELAERDAFAIWWYNRLRGAGSRSLRI